MAWNHREGRQQRVLPQELCLSDRQRRAGSFQNSSPTVLSWRRFCLSVIQATALYTYVGGSDEELPFSESDVLSIVDTPEGDWWKADKGGVVFLVPAAYLEVVDG